MAIELYISARTAAFGGGDPVDGVFCALYDNMAALVSVDTTGNPNADGTAYLGVVGVGTYEVRLTAPSGAVLTSSPRLVLTVGVGDSGQIALDAILDLSTISVPTSAWICRCAGLFVDPAGRPFAGATLVFSEKDIPQLIRNTGTDVAVAVLPRAITCKTDSSGYGTVDLVRGAEYAVLVGPLANTTIDIVVPDEPTAPLPDVVFPLVDRVEYIPVGGVLTPVAAPTLAMTVLEEKTLPIETVYRSGYRVAGLSRVSLTVSDDDIISIGLTSDGELLITALASGTATIEVERNDEETGTTVFPTTAPRGHLTVVVA